MPTNRPVNLGSPVEEWGFEGLLKAVESGDSMHWESIALALEADPSGKVARELDEVLEASPNGPRELYRRLRLSALAHTRELGAPGSS